MVEADLVERRSRLVAGDVTAELGGLARWPAATIAIAFQRTSERSRRSSPTSPATGGSWSSGIVLT